MMVQSSRHHRHHPHLCRRGAASQVAALISYDIVTQEHDGSIAVDRQGRRVQRLH
jgi:hypothetical protein